MSSPPREGIRFFAGGLRAASEVHLMIKYVKQILIIAAVCFAGEAVHYFVPLPIPASIYGMLILFLLLETGVLKVESIREVSTFLLDTMIIMFIPAGVGLMEYWGSIRDIWWKLIIVIVAVNAAVFAVSGWVTQAVGKKVGGK